MSRIEYIFRFQLYPHPASEQGLGEELRLYLLPGVIFVLLGLFVLRELAPIGRFGILGIGLVFLIIGGWMQLRKVLHVTVSESGIEVRTSLVKSLFMSWQEIQTVIIREGVVRVGTVTGGEVVADVKSIIDEQRILLRNMLEVLTKKHSVPFVAVPIGRQDLSWLWWWKAAAQFSAVYAVISMSVPDRFNDQWAAIILGLSAVLSVIGLLILARQIGKRKVGDESVAP